MLSNLAYTQPDLHPALCAGSRRGEQGGGGEGTRESKENMEGSRQGDVEGWREERKGGREERRERGCVKEKRTEERIIRKGI